METRRAFLSGLVLAGMTAGITAEALTAQNPPPKPSPSQLPTKEEPDWKGMSLPDPTKKALEDNDKNVKKKVERLYQLASELKDEMNKTDSSKVMSLELMRRAEEIERLARDIKNRLKG